MASRRQHGVGARGLAQFEGVQRELHHLDAAIEDVRERPRWFVCRHPHGAREASQRQRLHVAEGHRIGREVAVEVIEAHGGQRGLGVCALARAHADHDQLRAQAAQHGGDGGELRLDARVHLDDVRACGDDGAQHLGSLVRGEVREPGGPDAHLGRHEVGATESPVEHGFFLPESTVASVSGRAWP